MKKLSNTLLLTRMSILLIYTGGTIGMSRNSLSGALEPLDFAHLLRHIPELHEVAADIHTTQFEPPIDSSDVTPSQWESLARTIAGRYHDYDGFVILHGTDTMAYTASALSYMLGNLTKPVIFTGSQLPIGQLRTDGKENLITAVSIAAARDDEGRPLVPEVAIYFGGRLLRGNRTTKQSAEAFRAFASFNYPALADAGVDITYHRDLILRPDYGRGLQPFYALDPNVIIISLFPGMRGDILQHILQTPGLKAVVMRTFGSGNAPRHPWLLSALREAADRGLVIVNISQCVQGAVEMSRYDCGLHLQEAGVLSGLDSTVESAVTKLMHLLARYSGDTAAVRSLMTKNLRGEISV